MFDDRHHLPVTLRTLPWGALAVAAFVFLAPNVDLAANLQWHDGQRMAQLVLLAFVVLLAVAVPGTARRMTGVWNGLHPWIRIALAAAFALGLVSGLLAPLPRWALLEWGLLWLLLMLVFGVAAQRLQIGERLDHALVLLFLATATAYAVSACSIYVTMLLVGPVYGLGFDVRELYPGFSNVRFFGHVQTMLLPFLLLPAMWWGRTRVRRVLLWIAPAVWWMLAVGSGTRGTWAALLIGGIAAWLFGGRSGRQWIKWQGAGLLCGLLCYALFILLVPQLLDRPATFLHRAGDIVSLSLREVLWATSITFAEQHPLLGIGPMHYAFFATEVAAHPHNAVLQWAAEWGIPAALLFTTVSTIAGLTLARWVKRTADTDGETQGLVKVALLAALAGAAAQSMVDGILVMPVSQTLLALLCGWGVGVYFAGRDRMPRSRLAEHAVLMAVMVVVAVTVAYGVSPEILHIAEREQMYQAAHPDPRLLPRFWALGWIGR